MPGGRREGKRAPPLGTGGPIEFRGDFKGRPPAPPAEFPLPVPLSRPFPAPGMKQLALDIGLQTGPTLASFFAGPNEAALRHLQLWVGAGRGTVHSPVPTYLWGEGGSGKTH